MSISKYVKKKQQVFIELNIPLTDEDVLRMNGCNSQIAVDNIAHTIIMNHQYSVRAEGRS